MSFLPKGLLVKKQSFRTAVFISGTLPLLLFIPYPIVPKKHFLRGNSHEHSRHSGARVSE